MDKRNKLLSPWICSTLQNNLWTKKLSDSVSWAENPQVFSSLYRLCKSSDFLTRPIHQFHHLVGKEYEYPEILMLWQRP